MKVPCIVKSDCFTHQLKHVKLGELQHLNMDLDQNLSLGVGYLLVDSVVTVQVAKAEADVVPVLLHLLHLTTCVPVHADVVQRVRTSQPGNPQGERKTGQMVVAANALAQCLGNPNAILMRTKQPGYSKLLS